MNLLTLRRLHRWVALFVGLQVLVWTASGMMFAWIDHDEVQGAGLAEVPPLPTLPAEATVIDPSTLLRDLRDRAVKAIALRSVDGEWVYRIESDAGVELRRARDGSRFGIDGAVARRLASAHYRGDGRVVAVRFHPGPTPETRDAGATWQVDLADATATTLYFSADDGSLSAVRTDAWRLKDVFWMLHTMDYRGRDDFNNPLVVLAGSAAAWVALTGLWLIVRVFRPRRAPAGGAVAERRART